MASEAVRPPRRPPPVGLRGAVLVAILVAGLAASAAAGLRPSGLAPGRGGWSIARAFFSRAVTPALSYESASPPPGAPPLLEKALDAARKTVVFAAAGMSLALLLGLPLGFLAATSPWAGDPTRGGRRRASRVVAPAVYGGARVLAALLRSIHELLWAVLLLAAFGLSNLAAVLAIALPYAGVLAKVFSELVDEAPREAGEALRAAGASPLQVFFFGLLPRAFPDLAAYGFYRFECALRSSAVLGFFGYPTLGYYVAASFENLYYGEVWTYLYTLFALVAAADLWSGALRRRMVG